ncbi:MAG: hypothetical protein B6D38_04765 [Anaerolineae bacterium UTCFX1]|jgi:glycopeptide antibiotics resistance protein|nr:MAG: hypothetical protein B6D38_04765 [Anaerolineae bacterium UTCFX1]
MLFMMDLNAFYIAFAVLALVVVGVWLKSKDSFLAFFAFVFGVYLIGVISVVVFPIPIGYDVSDFKPNLNLIPFNFGVCDPRWREFCIWQIYQQNYQNILLTIPFGFGISFIARIKPKNIFWVALAVGFTFEFVQLVISLIVRSPFRAVDINDLIFNATGVLLGYGFFRIFGAIYLRVVQSCQSQPSHIFAYIHDIVRSHR